MALRASTSLHVVDRTVTFTDAYCTVASLSGSKSRMIANVEFRLARGGELIVARGYEFQHDCNSADGAFAQAYAHLKSLPEFSGCVDC